MKKRPLVIYVDESGTPDVFAKDGTNLVKTGRTQEHLVVAAVRCTDPSGLGRIFSELAKWADSKRRVPLGYVHASDDSTEIKMRVCETLAQQPVKVMAVVMDKLRLDPNREWIRDPARFYADMTQILLSQSLHRHETTQVILPTKSFEREDETQARVETLIQGYAQVLAGRIRAGAVPPQTVSISVDHARRRPGLQAADYAAWAILRAFELSDMTYYQMIEPIVSYVYDFGEMKHYSRRKPLKNPP